MEEIEGKAKQLCKKHQGWKESWKELLWQEPPISLPSEEKFHRVVQHLAMLGSE